MLRLKLRDDTVWPHPAALNDLQWSLQNDRELVRNIDGIEKEAAEVVHAYREFMGLPLHEQKNKLKLIEEAIP